MADDDSLDVGAVIRRFVQHIDSLASSLLLSMVVIQNARKVAVKSYEKFVEKNCTVEERGTDNVILVPLEHDRRYNILNKRAHQTSIAFSVVPRGFLVSLVSQFDAFIGRLLSVLLRHRPELLKASDRVLTFSQLSEFNSIDAAREYVLEKEIESLLRKSHAEQFDWLEKRFDIKLRVDLPTWPAFIEVTERRNLFVHSDGIVSSQYLKVCQEHAVVLSPAVTAGSELGVPHQYFIQAHAVIYEMGAKLAQVLWRKLVPSELEAADKSLSDLSFELVQEGNYDLAKTMLDFACKSPMKHVDERSKLVCLVNKAQAYKWSGDSVGALAIVKKQDWSATRDEFQLAEAVLTDNYKSAVALMTKIGASGYPHKEHYKTWPLFREFRKTEEFKAAFQEIFGEAPSRAEIDKSETARAEWDDSEQMPPDETVH